MFSAAATPAILPNFITGLAVLFNPNYEPQNWHKALIMWAFIFTPVIMNLFFRKALNTFRDDGWHYSFRILHRLYYRLSYDGAA